MIAMKINENRQQPLEAKEVMIQCTACGKNAVILFPYKPTRAQRLFAIREAAEAHRPQCTATLPEEQKEYTIWYPRK